MRNRRHFQKKLILILTLFGFCFLGGALDCLAAVSIGRPLRVRILYDNSGSMYPGYTPPGTTGRKTKSELGTRYYYEDSEFQGWLGDFVASQTILDGGTVEMWTFTSQGEFSTADFKQVHTEVPIAKFDVARAIRNIPSESGQTTYLTETLDHFSRGFEGLIWLITDNIVETRVGEPDRDVEKLFHALHEDPRYQAVHLFKHSFRGSPSALAIYGILVSPSTIPKPTLAYYDRKFRSNFRFVNRRKGDPPQQLFPGREHLKLRNLEVDAFELVPTLEATLNKSDAGSVKEGQKVQLKLTGEIRSYLTQHSAVGGHYRLEFVNDFEPESWASRELGAQAISAGSFSVVEGEIQDPIPPNGTRDITALLQSSQPVSFTGGGPNAWLKLALNGAVVRYTGRVRMSFQGVGMHLEKAQMAGIFGIDKAPGIFKLQDLQTFPVDSSEAPVEFTLSARSSRTVLLLALLLILVILAGLLAAFLARKQWYRVRITGTPEKLIPLRRLGSYSIVHDGQTFGRLTRGISGDYDFAANLNSAAFTISPTQQADTWDVRFRDGGGCQIIIEPQEGGAKKKSGGGANAGSGRPAPASGGPLAGGAPPPIRPLPKIDRPK